MLKRNKPFRSVIYTGIFAKMWSLISLVLLVAAAGHVHGVELYLSAVNLMRTDDSLPCGTVRCVDEVDPSNGYSIKSLQIRKELNREVLVNLNQEDTYFNCKFDGITANGNWTSYKAEAGLTLYNSQDCNDAEFICEVVHVDKLGVERTGSSSGRINGRFSIATPQTQLTCPKAWVDDITESLSSLADFETKSGAKILSKLDTLESNEAKHITKSESKMQDLASSVANIETKLDTLTKSESKIQDLASSVANIETKLEQQTQSDSKIQELSSTVANIQTKLEQLTQSDSKMQDLSSSVANIQTKLEQQTKSNAKILTKLDALTDTIKEVKTQQPLTTCPRSASATPDKRYQVVNSTDGTPYLCDTDGGWTVIQRRIDGKTNFYRNWYNYTHGFGSFDEDFWLGLEHIHQISSSSNHELNITMEYNGNLYYAHYDNFIVLREEYKYRLFVGAYTGTAGDGLSYNSNKPFSAYDNDNDSKDSQNCAQRRQGAWWYWDCTYVNLNGQWGAENKKGPEWRELTGGAPVTMTEMKIRKMI